MICYGRLTQDHRIDIPGRPAGNCHLRNDEFAPLSPFTARQGEPDFVSEAVRQPERVHEGLAEGDQRRAGIDDKTTFLFSIQKSFYNNQPGFPAFMAFDGVASVGLLFGFLSGVPQQLSALRSKSS